MARIPSLEVVYSWIPEENRHKLDQAFQSDYRSLAQIADNILEWDGPVGDELTLTHIERHDIKAENPFDTRQQRRRALHRWQEKFGSHATYRNLIIAFHKAKKMDYVEVVCRQLGGNCPPATPTPRNDSDTSLRSAASAQPNRPLSFLDSLSPVELADWLTQELVAKGLNLEASQRQSLLDEDINGKAFRELTDDHLKELGFKMGARINIKGIISSIATPMATAVTPPTQQPSAAEAFIRDPTLTTQALDEALESLVYWYTFGVKLGLPSHKLDMIQQDHHGVKNQKVALYNMWLETDVQASWSKLCDALWQEDKKVLATQLRAKYTTGKNTGQESGRTKSNSEGALQKLQASEIMDSLLLECLRGLSDTEVKYVGVALGISDNRLEGMGEGQRLVEAVSREVGRNWSWSELIQSLEGAGQSELAKRITINKNNIEQPAREHCSN